MTSSMALESEGFPAEPDIGQLSQVALKGLRPMFDPQSGLFCFRLKLGASDLIREGRSARYTLMTLLGLERAEAAGLESQIDIHTVLDDLLRDLSWVDNIGDLGLLLWTAAAVLPERLREIIARADVERKLSDCASARHGRSMELAWFLSGLSHAMLSDCRSALPGIRALAGWTCERLCLNQGEHGFFGHLAKSATLAGRLRGGIGSFADQVYPIYALSKFYEVSEKRQVLERARRCADAICRVQGELGQWWWHYDAVSGRVMERYPVYSVHQEGMAPMALFALEQAAGLDYEEPIERGLAWIFGRNEVGCDLRASSGIIWRCLRYRHTYRKHLDRVGGALGRNRDASSGDQLSILHECRPYELGWLLYAFADKPRTRLK